jgi:hypothetical protein
LGLQTSFALAQFWSRRPVGGFNSKIEFACHRCGTILTYRYELAGLFAVLALLPMIVVFPAFPPRSIDLWSYVLWPLIIANPPIEGD